MRCCSKCGAYYDQQSTVCPCCGSTFNPNAVKIFVLDIEQEDVASQTLAKQNTSDHSSYLSFVSCVAGDVQGYSICGCAMPSPEALMIPAEHNGDPVLRIEARAFLNNKFIREITLPDTLLQIGEAAFENCTALEAVIGGYSVLALEADAFKGCIQLERIEYLQRSSVHREYSTFAGCYHLNA